jgi:hypothetical protein
VLQILPHDGRRHSSLDQLRRHARRTVESRAGDARPLRRVSKVDYPALEVRAPTVLAEPVPARGREERQLLVLGRGADVTLRMKIPEWGWETHRL